MTTTLAYAQKIVDQAFDSARKALSDVIISDYPHDIDTPAPANRVMFYAALCKLAADQVATEIANYKEDNNDEIGAILLMDAARSICGGV